MSPKPLFSEISAPEFQQGFCMGFRNTGRTDGQAPATCEPDIRSASPLRKISAELTAEGFVNERRKPFHAQSIQRMIDGERPATSRARTRTAQWTT